MRAFPAASLLAALLPLQPLRAQATGVVFGRVADSTGTPLDGALVTIAGTTLRTSTESGRYRLTRVPAGRVVVRVQRLGYFPGADTVDLAAGDSARANVVLQPSPITVQELVVTAAKRSQLAEEAVTSVAQVTEADVARRAVNTVDEAVDKAPGVQFLNGQVNLRGSSGYVQGLGARVLLLVDGVPANQGDRGGINWDIIPIDEIERVEVVKGAGSALYGSAALGGVVNLITREIPLGLHARVRATGGVYGNPPHPIWRFRDFTGTHGGLDVTASYGDEMVRGSLSAGGRHSDGYRQQDRSDHWQLAGKGEWHPAVLTLLNVSGALASDQYQVPLVWCVRGSCDDRGQAYQPFLIDTSGLGTHTRSDKGYLAATLAHTPSARFAWQVRGSWLRTHFIDYQPGGDDFGIANRFGAEVRGEAHPAESRVATVGAEVTRSDARSNIFGTHSQTEFAAYGESEHRFGAARVSAGARIDYMAVDGGGLSAVVSPRAGGVLPTHAGVWRASVGRGFRAPSLAERFVATVVTPFVVVPNPNLHPETAWSFELGNAAQLMRVVRSDVALFWTEAEDLIEPSVNPSTVQIQFRNVARARLAGLDVALAATPFTPRLATTLAYTFLVARELTHDTVPERPLAFRPKHLLTLGADYGWGPFGVGGDFRYMSRFERVELYPNDPLVAAKVLDLRASFERRPLTARLLIANALNYVYNLVPRTLAPVRVVSVTLTWTY